jgi:aspartate dehydrogenase
VTVVLRLVLVGWGAIGARVAGLLAARGAAVDLVGVALRDLGAAREGLGDLRVISETSELCGLRPDLVVEAAGRGAALAWGRAALQAGADFCPASLSALVEAEDLAALVDLARARGRQVLIPAGAVGGMDALSAAARLELRAVTHEISKPPVAWAGTGAEALCDLAHLTQAQCFYEGTAGDAAEAFPQNANVAAMTALAGVGFARTRVRLIADPGLAMNRHRIQAEGDFGRMEITLDNRPLAGNPKSSELTALSLVRLIENRANPLVI